MYSVLICDSDPTVRTNIINKLHELGVDDIFECCDGVSAKHLASDFLPDIAIIGTELPLNNGLSAACEIRRMHKIPVILLLPHYDSDTLIKAKKNGITSILTKPVREQDLLPAIEIALVYAKEIELLKEQVKHLESTIETQNFIYKAKKVIQSSEGLSESEAFRMIQKQAMDRQKSMRQVAEEILHSEQLLRGGTVNKGKTTLGVCAFAG
jgi:response regulator NasT